MNDHRCRTRPAPGQRKARGFVPSSDFRRSQWLADAIVPGRELLVCLVLVAGEALRGGAEVVSADGGESHRGLHPGPDDGSSDKVGRADGARRNTEDGQGRHVEAKVAETRGQWEGRGGG